MVDLIKKSDCTGCKMCEDICPCGAITFRNEKDGFWYPVVDSENVQGADYVLANVRYKEHIQVKIKENRKSTQPGLEMTGHG